MKETYVKNLSDRPAFFEPSALVSEKELLWLLCSRKRKNIVHVHLIIIPDMSIPELFSVKRKAKWTAKLNYIWFAKKKKVATNLIVFSLFSNQSNQAIDLLV